ncbi:MAG: hypothetical protein R3218_01125, partial [Christiangramia sp.]|nr:hypothetical protein [Christiangramia sp.]
EGILVGGNTYRSNNYQGTYSALQGYIIKNMNSIIPVSDLGMEPFKHEVIAIEEVDLQDHKLMLIINNDAPLQSYRYEN